MKIFSDITRTVGRTPLVRLGRLGQGCGASVVLKLEFFNPLGSVKDRIGLAMIEAAEAAGLIRPGGHVIEPTSGNTGVALAFVCAQRGYKLTLVMPETMSNERRTLLIFLGAEVVLTPASLGMRGAIAKSLELGRTSPGAFLPRQFENPNNPKVHSETTALEIWEDTDGQVDAVVSGVGTGGTFSGVGRVLKGKKASLRMIAVEPFESSVLSGLAPGPHKIQGIGAGFVPGNFDRSLADRIERVSSEECLAMARRLIKEEGIPAGISSGASVAAALRLARDADYAGKMIVAIIPSYTERYLSTMLAEQERQQAQTLSVSAVLDSDLAQVPLGPLSLP